MADFYGSTQWYINRDLTGDVWYVNATTGESSWTIPRTGKILGPYKGESERPPQEYSGINGEKTNPRTTGSTSSSAPPPTPTPGPARTSAPPPYQFPPPPAYAIPRPTVVAAASPTLLQRVQTFFTGLENDSTALQAIRTFKPYIQQVRQAIRTGQLDVSQFKSAAVKAFKKYHPDKGGDETISKELQPLLGESEGIGFRGSGIHQHKYNLAHTRALKNRSRKQMYQ